MATPGTAYNPSQNGGQQTSGTYNPNDPVQNYRKLPNGNYYNPQTGETMDANSWTAAYHNWDSLRLDQQGLNPDGSPKIADYNSPMDSSGNLLSQYQATPQKADISGLDSYSQYKANATAPGMTTWGQLQKQLLDTQGAQAKSNLVGQNSQSQAQARSSLGMRGGLSSGARERLAVSGARNLQTGNQSLANQSSQNLLSLGASDAQQKQNMLGNLLSTDVNNTQFNTTAANQGQQYNISNALNANTQQNAYNMGKYGELMKKYAANASGQAIQSGGGAQGSWVCTEINKIKPFTKEESRILFGLRKYSLYFHKEDSKYYFYEMKPLVEKMVKAGFNFANLRPWIDSVIEKSWERKFEKAYKIYVAKIISLASEFGMKNEKLIKIEGELI